MRRAIPVRTTSIGLALASVAALSLIVAGGCGGDGKEQARSTPPGTHVAPTGTRPATASAQTVTPAPTGALASVVTIVARDNAFEPAALRVPRGEEVTLTLRNEGLALHDWQAINVRDQGGNAIKTDLLPAGHSATIRFTIPTAGEYAFYCEVHPVEMRGRLTVQ